MVEHADREEQEAGLLKPAEAADMRILVLGVGNSRKGDHGLGVAVARKLLGGYVFPRDVAVVDGGAGSLRLLPLVAVAEQVFIIDAIEAGSKPGSIYMFNSEELGAAPTTRLAKDNLDLLEILQAADMGGQESVATIIGVQPGKNRRFGDGLSREVQAAIPKIVDIVIELLTASGCKPQPRAASQSMASGAQFA